MSRPTTPGSIHEGGELGYSLSHAFGAAFDNPDLIVACVVGDGEAETGPLATAWQSNKFLDPITDGAVLPILHLNGYKISNPTSSRASSREELEQFLRGCGWAPLFVEGDEPDDASADGGDAGRRRSARSRRSSRTRGTQANPARPRWPMIVLAIPQRLDRPQGRRRLEDRRHFPRPSGASSRRRGASRTCPAPGKLDEELPARGTLRRQRPL